MYRNLNDKVIGGVCSGLAKGFNCDAVAIRALFVLSFVFFGTGLLLYILLWILMKPEGGA